MPENPDPNKIHASRLKQATLMSMSPEEVDAMFCKDCLMGFIDVWIAQTKELKERDRERTEKALEGSVEGTDLDLDEEVERVLYATAIESTFRFGLITGLALAKIALTDGFVQGPTEAEEKS